MNSIRRHTPILLLVFGLLFTLTAWAFAQPAEISLIIRAVDEDGLDQALARFTEKTGIHVEVIQSTGWPDHRERVATMAAAGVVPDVLYCEGGSFNFFLMNHLIRSLDDYVARDIDLSKFPAPVLPFWQQEGRLYGIPTALSLHNTYYNVDRYEQAGVTPPTLDWAGDDWGWDDFVSTMRKLNRDDNGDGTPEQYGLQGFGWGGGINHLGLWNLWMVDEAVTEYYGDSPAVIEAIEKHVALWTQYNVVGGNLVRGTAATSLVQAGSLNSFLAAGDQLHWGVGAMPKGDARASQTGYHGLCVARESKHPDEAWELVKYLAYDEEGATLFTRAENRVPVLAATAQDFILRFSEVIPESMVRTITDGANYIYNTRYGRHPKGNDMYNMWVPLQAEMTQGHASVREAMERVAPAIRALIAER